MFTGSRFDEIVVTDLKVGGCFWQYLEGAVDRVGGGLCGIGERPLQSWVNLPEGQEAIKDFGDVTVQRGETRTFSHTFTFTSTAPGVVEVSAGSQERVLTEGRLISRNDDSVRITFEP